MARADEAAKIRQANRASAAGRLLLGEFHDWSQFLSPETDDLERLPRRMLKAGKVDVQKRLSKEIRRFCEQNFIGMDIPKLSKLYEEIKAHRGLEMPLTEFEATFATVKDRVLRGSPRHATVVISLWGLQFKYPEHMLARDIAEALTLLARAEKILKGHEDKSHQSVVREREQVGSAIALENFSCRACLLACANLIEAFLNGLAWDFSRAPGNIANLSEKGKKLIQDATLRDKIIKYPKIITGKALWTENDEQVKSFLEQVKPFRDSLVHPSPFSTPERFGGVDKLERIYRIDPKIARQAARISVEVIERMFRHIRGHDAELPDWLHDVEDAVAAAGEDR